MPSLNDQIRSAELFIENMSKTPSIQEAFASVGRDAAFIQQGQQLLEEVRRLYRQKQDEYGDQYGGTTDLYEARDAAHDAYMEHLDFARIVFETDANAQESLQLAGERRRALNDWLSQGRSFYEGLLEDEVLLEQMGTLMITREDLEAGRAQIEEVAAIHDARQREMSEAQRTTDRRDQALDRLNDWIRQNRRIARVLFRKDPQHLEALGIRA